MPVDERARHRLYLKLEEVLGPEEAGILMDHLPPGGFGDLATKRDLEQLRLATRSDLEQLRLATKSDMEHLRAAMGSDMEHFRAAMGSDMEHLRATMGSDMAALEHKLTTLIERSIRRVVMWTSSMVLATGGLAVAVTRLA